VLDHWRVLFWAALALGALVTVFLGASFVRSRKAERREPAKFVEHAHHELRYTMVPLVVVVVLFGLAAFTQRDVDRLDAEPGVRIEVTGFQWGWRFVYLTEGITVVGTAAEPPTLLLPVGTTARLVLRSSDVVHSFSVPEFLTKRALVPGTESRLDVTPSQTGRFGGTCAYFCGLDHARMAFVVEVVGQDEFDEFVTGLQELQQPPPGPTPPGEDERPGDLAGQAAPRPGPGTPQRPPV
jgi:cytochrome c oxidase subunit II